MPTDATVAPNAGGRLQWCWLQLGDAALMLQEYRRDGAEVSAPDGPRWVTSVRDPNGYRLDFESPTEAPEETVYAG